MKRIVTYTALLFSLCAFAQSPSTVLSTLHTRGTTSVGGDPKYFNYIPKLDERGLVSTTFIDTQYFIDLFNERGSEVDQNRIDAVESSLGPLADNIISNSVEIAANAASNAVSKFSETLSDYESDPVFITWFESENNCVGKHAVSLYPTAIQIGAGTNTTAGTLKVLDKELICEDGFIPTNMLPWAATTNDVSNTYNSLVDILSPKDSPDFTGEVSIDSRYDLIKFNKTSQRLSFDGSFMCLSGFGGCAQMAGVVIETHVDTQEHSYEIHYPVRGLAEYDSTNACYRFNLENYSTNNSFYVDVLYATDHAKYCVRITKELDGVSTTCESYETDSEHASIEDTARELKIHIETKNPHGITLEDIKEPTSYIDLKSQGGNIFRIKVLDDGSITSTRIK